MAQGYVYELAEKRGPANVQWPWIADQSSTNRPHSWIYQPTNQSACRKKPQSGGQSLKLSSLSVLNVRHRSIFCIYCVLVIEAVAKIINY